MTVATKPKTSKEFTPEARTIISQANAFAAFYGLPSITSTMLLLAILKNAPNLASNKISKLVPINTLIDHIEKANTKVDGADLGKSLPVGPDLRAACLVAEKEAEDRGEAIGTLHVLLGILKAPHVHAGMYLNFYGMTYDNLKFDMNNSTKSDLSAPCGPSCGCSHPKAPSTPIAAPAASVANSIDTAATTKNSDATAQANQSPSKLNDWQVVLEEALLIAEHTGLGVPAAFVQAAMTHKSAMTSEQVKQIRQSTINDIVQNLLAS